MDIINLSYVEFAKSMWFGGRSWTQVTEGQDGVYFIQARQHGARIVFDNSRPSVIVPWHNVTYAEETEV